MEYISFGLVARIEFDSSGLPAERLRYKRGNFTVRNEMIRRSDLPKYRPVTPGDVIRDMFLEEETFGFTQSQVADRLGISRRSFSAVLNGKRAVTPAMAMRLERVVGLSAGTWLNLQRSVDMYDVLHGPEAKEIAKLKPLMVRKTSKRSKAAA